MNLQQIQKLITKHGANFIDIKFCDLPGNMHHITLPIKSLNDELFKWGVGVDGSSLPGFTSIERGDMILIPDPTTVFVEPFCSQPTISFLGDIMDAGDKIGPYSRNPRRVASSAEAHLNKMFKGARAMMGPEFEFYIFEQADYHQESGMAYYVLRSDESGRRDGEQEENLGYKIPHRKGYHIAPPNDRTFSLRSEISTLLSQVGIELKYHHHEVGGKGQLEIEVGFSPLLKMGDSTMLAKYVIKNHCFRVGKSVTFMPKPLFNEPGSGLHVHQYLANATTSLFYDKNGPNHFSKIGLYYIGGLLKHVDSVLAFTNPSTNSFKRLVPGFEAPIAGNYSVGNRTACIRIPGYQRNPKTTRFEFRPGDGTMNPYLGYAAMLMAGLDGIKHKIDPGEALDKNLDELPKSELEKIHQLPASLPAALDALEKDHKYLLEGCVFTEDLLESWLTLKRKDVHSTSVMPSPGEFELYYDC